MTTIYKVHLVKGDDDHYDATSTPRTLLETADRSEAIALFEALETESPVVVVYYEDEEGKEIQDLIRG